MKGAAILRNSQLRGAVESASRDVCHHKEWTLEALNVRTNHVHAVVGATFTRRVIYFTHPPLPVGPRAE